MGHSNVGFILSTGKNFKVTTISTMFPDASDFIIIDKKPYFIHTSSHQVRKCTDGKSHSFWVYNILSFEKDEIKVMNSINESFPKTIWYSFKPNHKETSLLTVAQKAEIQKESLDSIYWKEKEIKD